MDVDAGFWPEGRRSWERLARWRQDMSAAPSRPHDEGDQALQALTDIGVVRRLLDQIEFEAIRVGRRQGKSWAEIAIRLGITRQSAWERWQDVDQPERQRPRSDPEWEITTDDIGRIEVPPPDPPNTDIQAAVARRHRSIVVVPNVIGMTGDGAREVLRQVRLVGVGPDLDGPPLADLNWPDGIVTDQSPESGAMVPPGSAVRLWVERDGGSGVREPRRPKPDPKTGRKMRDEATDEAVG